MKMKKTGSKLLVFSLVVLIIIFSAFSVSAVGEEDEIGGDEYVETQAPETQAPETEAPTYETQAPETEAPTYETQAPETQAPETEAPVQEETQAQQETFAVLDNDLDDLPEADTAPHPTAPRTKKAKQAGDMTYGIISWACVIVGVLTVIIVILSNKTGYYGGSGKQRYDEGNKITGQKRLLSDDYYTTRKYNSYQDRDNYR